MIRLYVIEDRSSIIVPGLKRLFYSSRDGITVAGASESVEAAILDSPSGKPTVLGFLPLFFGSLATINGVFSSMGVLFISHWQ